MDKMQILKRLCAIGKGNSEWHEPLTADRLDQTELYKVQEDLVLLMQDLAREIPGGPVLLNQQFPHVFEIARLPVLPG